MPWLTLLLLGAFHGVNPAMGWLFALSNGLQARSVRGVLRSLPPIGLGHVLSVGAVAVVVELTGKALPARAAPLTVGAGLVGFGVWRLLSRRHIRWVGMRLSWRGLLLWSFLVASAHGAGLMLAPVLLHRSGSQHGSSAFIYWCRVSVGNLRPSVVSGLGAAAVHGGATLAVLSLVAVAVYRAANLRLLQRAWLNLDRVWAVALVGAGMLVAL
jgi:hypothetical protein